MKRFQHIAVVAVFFPVFLAIAPWAVAQPGPVITDVKISPAGDHVLLTSTGPISAHEDFLVGNPNRLVIDFIGARFGRVDTIRPPQGAPVHSIRFSPRPDSARMIVDFGTNPVPPYRIHRENTRAVVILEGRAGSVRQRKPPRARQLQSTKKPAAKRAVTETNQQCAKPDIGVASAHVEENTIVVELAGPGESKEKRTLILKIDENPLRIVSASLHKNPPVKAQMKGSSEVPKRPGNVEHGPRKSSPAKQKAAPDEKKYQWGKLTVEPRGPGALRPDRTAPMSRPTVRSGGPVQSPDGRKPQRSSRRHSGFQIQSFSLEHANNQSAPFAVSARRQ